MTDIQWFPGHMAKARREVSEKLSWVDIIVELVDARLPLSSQNPILQDLVHNKKWVRVLNKADLADPNLTQAWLQAFQAEGRPSLAIDAQHNQGIRRLQGVLLDQMADRRAQLEAKGVKPPAIRLMIIGIPNVGKSTLINRFVGKNMAQTGAKPGVTRAQRWLKIGRDFELLDTPGILWPKFEDAEVGKKLALTGAIKDQLLHMDDLALYLLEALRAFYPQVLTDKLKLQPDQVASLDTPDLLLALTRQWGYQEDYDRASQDLIHRFRQGRLGRISLDREPGHGS